ncbi:MAG TPA: Ig domain-containing protein, partial [Balneolales bacterium]|nr:Ig domain-containing protein [Balneolales bacterium]
TTFNQPPRFSPVHSMSLAVNQAFTLNFHAVDPDGTNRNLVRYLGVNLPKGASINEHTGQFSWTPNSQQVGKNTFRVIATDQYGAAASMTVNLTVVNVKQ